MAAVRPPAGGGRAVDRRATVARAARRRRAGVPAGRLGLPGARRRAPVRVCRGARDARLAGTRGAGRRAPATWRRARCWPRAACRSREAEEVTSADDGARRRGGDRLPGGAQGARRRAQVGRRRRGARPRHAGGAGRGARRPHGAARRRRRSASSGWWSRPVSAELVCGVIWDPRFGPVALVGGGGTAVELLDDVVLALAPLTPAEAEAALRRLRTFPLLDGYRGRPRSPSVPRPRRSPR